MFRSALCVLLLVVAVAWCVAQPAATPVDRKDPEAVVKAYVKACEVGDVKAAAALLEDKGGVRRGVETVVAELADPAKVGFSFRDFPAELSFLPLGWKPSAGTTQAKTEGNAATVTLTEAVTVTRKFVLAQGPDGTWSIDLEKSILTTTGGKTSLVMMQLLRGPGSPGGGGPDRSRWNARNQIQKLNQVLMAYIGENGEKLPPAETWMDVIEKYCLDRSILHRKDLKPDQYGYAINSQAAGKPLPQNWEERRSMVIVFETDDPARNASADPDALPARKPDSPTVWVATADGNVVSLPVGMTLQEMREAQPLEDTCSQHMRMIGQALLAYARDHDGKMPPGDAWCDEIGPYIKPDRAGGKDVFQCPAEPDLKFAYALNADLAGKDVRTLTDHSTYVLLLHGKTGAKNEVMPLPAKAEKPVHMGGRYYGEMGAHDIVVMLDGNQSVVAEGQPYPTGPMGGR